MSNVFTSFGRRLQETMSKLVPDRRSYICLGYTLPGPGVPIDAPLHDYSKILGASAVLKPAGENRIFDAALPRRGILTRQIALDDWGSDWLVLEFKEPLCYKGRSYSCVLIRAKWIGTPIGKEFCPVFVLLDGEAALTKMGSWSSAEFQFESWAEVELVHD